MTEGMCISSKDIYSLARGCEGDMIKISTEELKCLKVQHLTV